MVNYKGIKNKLKRFKAIFTDHWSAFVAQHARYNTRIISEKLIKCLIVGVKQQALLFFNAYLGVKGNIKSISVVKGKPVHNVESAMPEKA